MPTPSVRLARQAMATRFECVLHGDNEVSLRAAGEEALDEIARLEGLLSLYRPTSDVSRVNAAAGHDWVRVAPPVFDLLRQAVNLHRQSAGTFDITIAPLMITWGLTGGAGHIPDPVDLDAARERVGMVKLELDPERNAVRLTREGMKIDLGAIGKGFALDCARDLLLEAGVTSALIHGGTSTVLAIGTPPDATGWKIALERPDPPQPDAPPGLWTTLLLSDMALSVSAVWGKGFQTGGRYYGHIIDPRTGEPARSARMAAVLHPSATTTDALSTGLLLEGPEGVARLAEQCGDLQCLAVGEPAKEHEPPFWKAHGLRLPDLSRG